MPLLELECFVKSSNERHTLRKDVSEMLLYLLHSSSDYGNIRHVSAETYWVLVSFWKSAHWKSYSGSYIIFYSIWVKFGIRELLILLGSIPSVKIGPGKAVFVAVNVSTRTLTRVSWNRMLFWTQKSPRENYVLRHSVRYLRSCIFHFLLETSDWYYSQIQCYCYC
jgi:hypothetical protein